MRAGDTKLEPHLQAIVDLLHDAGFAVDLDGGTAEDGSGVVMLRFRKVSAADMAIIRAGGQV